MDPTLPWYKSAIIRQQIVQLIVAGLALVGITTDVDWNTTVEAVFAGIAAVVAVWTVFTRLFKPAPNITAAAAEEEKRLVTTGKIPKQGGFARPLMLAVLLGVAVPGVLIVAGCQSLGMAQPQGYDQKVAYTRGQLTAFVNATAASVETGQLDKEDGRRVLNMAKEAREFMDAGDVAFAAGDLSTAEGRVALAIGILAQLKTFTAKE